MSSDDRSKQRPDCSGLSLSGVEVGHCPGLQSPGTVGDMEDFPSDVIDELPLDLANPTTFYCLPSTTTLYNHPHLPESKFTRCAYPMKILTRAEEEDHYQAVIKGGTRWGLTGLSGGTTAAFIANRYWSGFRNLTVLSHSSIPLKAFAITSIGTFSLMIGADRASRAYDDNKFDHDPDGRWNDQNLEHRLGIDGDQDSDHDPLHKQRLDSLSSRDKLLGYFKEKQYEIVLGSWAASMVGSFALVAAQPMPFTQKLVQARMYAQSLTVAMILASAGLASMASSSTDDAASEQALRTNSMFKKGSPHEQREQELKDSKIQQIS
ncbi:hypothetical protein MJO29_008683 [Puccinia striiformis f. sp. tritici]|nr:hypothetical protein MJO29_008683 [Puccinia striiformis f. sp. tritici]